MFLLGASCARPGYRERRHWINWLGPRGHVDILQLYFIIDIWNRSLFCILVVVLKSKYTLSLKNGLFYGHWHGRSLGVCIWNHQIRINPFWLAWPIFELPFLTLPELLPILDFQINPTNLDQSGAKHNHVTFT